MRNSIGLQSSSTYSSQPQGYLGYLTSKQLQQFGKFKRDHDSDRESLISGYSGKGRRSKIRHVE
jgi:hypothetical protein